MTARYDELGPVAIRCAASWSGHGFDV